MSYHADKLGVDAHARTHTHTDAGNDNTRRPKLASGKNDTVKAKNAEITNYGIMRIFNEVISNKQLITQGTIYQHLHTEFEKKNQTVPCMFLRANKVPSEINKWIIKTRWVDGMPTSEVTPVTIW